MGLPILAQIAKTEQPYAVLNAAAPFMSVWGSFYPSAHELYAYLYFFTAEVSYAHNKLIIFYFRAGVYIEGVH